MTKTKTKQNKLKMIEVLEVDQIHGAVMMAEMKKGAVYNMDDFEISNVHGTDTDAAKMIFGGDFRILKVSADDKTCACGYVRFRIKRTGRLEAKYWAMNWDTSG